jgi:nucleotide-binding universal stress UspA family protein
MKIMLYYDGTENTKQALSLVKTRAKAFNAQVDVVSSLHKGGEAQLNEIEKREDGLAYIKSVLETQEIPCETHLLIKGNDVGNDITHFAKAHKVDEIVIGTSKKSLLEKFFMSLTARYVINNSQCPVLII